MKLFEIWMYKIVKIVNSLYHILEDQLTTE